MEEKLWKINCAPECGFAVQSHDKKEVMNMTKQHSAQVHHKQVNDNELQSVLQTA